ncbi:hypothetical protein ABEF92_004008 [Exophiala dermatitidis]|uniref:Protein kinase domain-containing protein n=1 Tax=Exophiala dermatitidis (strain ATCC 34100 / CBS 525.76 / NIH/UT8656) TaxID=858893 RepID=H6BZP7_EXODN|nr:uncharacterized protein HMPREF1120_05151 [Exophiala dermatitidis NIH/UT8656]EHY57101.1 hypothetical protein HMPREF1120_05151 [Exophiala dermatitidis NIH/UT8656]
MSSKSLNRRTRIDFDAIRGFRGPSQSVTRQDDHLTDGETPSRRGTGFNPAAGFPRALSSGTYRTTSATGSKPLNPPAALGHGTENTLIVKHQSPWEKYRKSHCIRLGEEDDDMVDVADVRHPWSADFIVPPQKEGPTPYVVAILNGLVYLATKGLEHGSLTTSNILINVAGEITAHQELCRPCPLSNPGSRDLKALSSITMELMQKYAKADGAVGVDDLRRWPSDSLAVEFLSETTSATSAERLLKASDGPQISSWV